jgi:tellurite resistance protein TerC
MILRTGDLAPAPRGFSLPFRRIAIAIAGFSVLALGLALVVVPVPGTSIVVIPLGLGILAKEFTWAKRTLAWATRAAQAVWFVVRQVFGIRLAPAPAR